jgi:hypothetical protein
MMLPCGGDRFNQGYGFAHCSLESACDILGGCTHTNCFVARCGQYDFLSALLAQMSGGFSRALLVLVSVALLTVMHTTSYCKGRKVHV